MNKKVESIKGLLRDAIISGNVKKVKTIIYESELSEEQVHSIVNTPFRGFDYTPLILARKPKIIELLIESGADVNAASKGTFRTTPILSAISDAESEKVELLIKHNVDLESPELLSEAIEMLLENNLRNERESLQIINLLINDPRTVVNESHLMEAANTCSVPLVKLLLKTTEFDIDSRDEEGNTALFRASTSFDSIEPTPMVEYLIQNNANVNARNYAGETPLMVAMRPMQYDTVKTLIDNEADVTAINENGKNVIQYLEDSKSRFDDDDFYAEEYLQMKNEEYRKIKNIPEIQREIQREMIWKSRKPFISMVESMPGDNEILRMNKETGRYEFINPAYKAFYPQLRYFGDENMEKEIASYLVPIEYREDEEEHGGKRKSKTTRKSKSRIHRTTRRRKI
jgi:ankyrin repeat protein